jgi:uncharacterized repeat protein (TIGR02543 family)
VIDDQQALTCLDASLVEASSISGVVTTVSEQLLDDTVVTLYRQDGADWVVLASTVTSSGSYRFAGLKAGNYRLAFSDPDGLYLPRFWPNASALATAETISLTTGQLLVDCDATLSLAGSITGVVKTTSDAALPGTTVTLYSPAGVPLASTVTDANGNYLFAALNAGNYLLGFAPADDAWIAQFAFNRDALTEADPITVIAGLPTNVSVYLMPKPSTPPPAPAPCTLTFVTDFGTAPSSRSLAYNTPLVFLPTLTWPGQVFTGWFDYSNTPISEGYRITADLTLYAHWHPASTCILSFDSYGGSAVAPRTVTAGVAIGTLPTPDFPNFSFLGWYTAPFGNGECITENSIISENTSIYAHWQNTGTGTGDLPGNTTQEGSDLTDEEQDQNLVTIPVPSTSDATPETKPEKPPVVPKKKSTNSYLKSLKASKGKLSKRFSKKRLSYTLALSKKTATVTIRATKADGKAKVYIRKTGAKFKAKTTVKVKLKKGKKTTVSIKVKAESGATRTYKIKVTRKP